MPSTQAATQRTGLVGLFVLIVVASAPAWTGAWIYDDWKMAGRVSADALSTQLLSVWRSTSVDYLSGNPDSAAGVTYRPLTMATLIATHALSPTPLLHHLVSVALHIATAAILYACLTLLCGARTALLLAGVFALHPLAIETYGWINGRSDLMAGLGAALLAYGLQRGGARSGVLVFCGTLIACLSKETGFPACLALLTAAVLPETGVPTRSRVKGLLPALAFGLLGIGASLAPRFLIANMKSLGSPGLLSDLSSPSLILRLFGVAAESWLVPVPRTMLGLSWQLYQAISWPRIVLLGLFALALLAAVAKRRHRAALLVFCAFLLLTPTTLVRHAGMWLGFDRYLYISTILLCLAFGSTALPSRVNAASLGAFRAITIGTFTLLGLTSLATASHYHDQSAFIKSMIALRPNDPTGVVYAATWTFVPAQAREHGLQLSRLDTGLMPPPMALHVASRLDVAGRREDAQRIVSSIEERRTRDPFVIRRLAHLRLQFLDVERASSLAKQLRPYPATFCESLVSFARKQLMTDAYKEERGRQSAISFVNAPPCRVE